MQIFEPKVRDRAIETTCSNLIMAGLLKPCEVAGYLAILHSYNNSQLAKVLCCSRALLDGHLERDWNLN